MKDYIEEACETIDASFFSGDTFHDSEERKAVKFYIDRWIREIASLETSEALVMGNKDVKTD